MLVTQKFMLVAHKHMLVTQTFMLVTNSTSETLGLGQGARSATKFLYIYIFFVLPSSMTM